MTTSGNESDCIFCRIVRGTAESAKVFEDEQTLAFIASPPAVDGHTLVVPKRHSRNIFDIAPADLAAVIVMVKKVAEGQRARLGCEGVSAYQANEAAGFQTVFHFHMHVLPRWTGDAIRPAWDAREVEASDLELERVAQRLRS